MRLPAALQGGSKKDIFMFGNVGGRNAGDEALLTAVLARLPRERCVVICAGARARATLARRHSVRTLPALPFGVRSLFLAWPVTMWRLRNAGAAVFLGGLLQDAEPPAALMWSAFARLCQAFTVPVFFLGNSVGPLAGRFSRAASGAALRRAAGVSVRDAPSAALCRSLGVPTKQLFQATDALFLLLDAHIPRPKKAKRGVAACLRKASTHDAFLKKSAMNMPVNRIALDKADMAPDATFLGDLPTRSALARLANSELILSERLHGCLFALLLGLPFVGLASRQKVPDFFANTFFSAYILPAKSDKKTVQTALQHALNNKKEFSDQAKKFCAQHRQIAKEHFFCAS